LFKLDTHQPVARHWLHDTWLHSSDKLAAQFGEVDWAQVPKLDYASVLFKQLATPESAKVHDNSEGFVLETFGLPLPTPRSEKKSELAAKALAESAALAAAEKPLTPPLQATPPKEVIDTSVLFGEESFGPVPTLMCGICSPMTALLTKCLIQPTGLLPVKWLTKKVLQRDAMRVIWPVKPKGMRAAS